MPALRGGRAGFVDDDVLAAAGDDEARRAGTERAAPIWLAMMPEGTNMAAGLPTPVGVGLLELVDGGVLAVAGRRPRRPRPWPGASPGVGG